MYPTTNQDIGVIGSPSTNTEITTDLLLEATEERIVGALVAFDATQSGLPIKSVGQIVGVELKNRWHEDSVFRNLIKRTGEIPPVTNRQDTRTANLVVGATFKRDGEEYEPDVLGMVPPTGTRIARVDQPLLDSLLQVYQKEIFYLGRAYANDVYYPMWFKHFGTGLRGAGEAYHLGVFGKTGSGKSGLAKMLLLAYARHPELGILIIDPQGEFSHELNGIRIGEQDLAVDQVLKAMGRTIQRYGITDIRLDEWDLLEELLLNRRFFQDGLGIRGQQQAQFAAELVATNLQRQSNKLDALCDEATLRLVLDYVKQKAGQIYVSKPTEDRLRERTQGLLNDRAELTEIFEQYWKPVTELFASGPGKRNLFGIVSDLMGTGKTQSPRPVVVVDISQRGNSRVWNEELQNRILARLLDILILHSTETLSQEQSANILVLLDEAHRHAPSGSLERGSQADQLRSVLRRAVRETRKYGLARIHRTKAWS